MVLYLLKGIEIYGMSNEPVDVIYLHCHIVDDQTLQ
jgi:hypothetical protein